MPYRIQTLQIILSLFHHDSQLKLYELSVKFEFDTASVEDFIARQEINHNNVNRSYILEAIKDSLKRLIVPNICLPFIGGCSNRFLKFSLKTSIA
jgi:aryl-alcohol dehydrogenase-like predicted oxidoreductase